MTTPDTGHERWLNRPGSPTAVVLFGAAALLAALTAFAMVEVFMDPLPPIQYGLFGDPHTFTGAAVLLVVLGVWAARGLSSSALSRTLLILIAAGPVGWGVAFLDAIGRDWMNSTGSASSFLALFLLVVAPVVTVVGVVATIAEIVRGSQH